METRQLLNWLISLLFVLVGVALIFVRVDRDELRAKAHSSPGLALYRFRVFRYGVAIVLFAMAALSFIESSR